MIQLRKVSLIKLVPCLLLISGLAACDQMAQPESATTNASPAETTSNPQRNSGNRKLSQAMDICLDNFPNMLAVRNDLRSSNFNSYVRRGGVEFFSAFNDNIFAFASTGSSDQRCGFGRNGLRDDEAVQVAKSILTAKYGDSLFEFDFSAEDGWLAAFYTKTDNGTEVDIFVRRQIAIAGGYRGSLIYVYEHTEPDE